ncbi:MAG: hypothetical protein GX303_08425 [Clostridiales bacterium]|nr:hypothetical protein [Clostridiales bacterium]
MKKQSIFFVFFAVFGLNILTSAALSPVYVRLVSDVVYRNTYLPDLLYYAMGFLNVVTLFIGYGAIVYGVCTRSIKAAAPYIAIALSGLLLNYIISFIFDYFGYVNGMPVTVLLEALIYFGINFAAECLKIFLIVLFSVLVTKKLASSNKKLTWKIFDKGHPLFLSMLFTALLFVLIAVLNELSNTIDFFAYYGSDIRPNEIASIVYIYLSIILSGAIGYFVMLFTALSLNSRREEISDIRTK